MRPGGRGVGGTYRTILSTTYGSATLTGNVVSPQFFSYSFALNQFANYSAYASLFDSYRIRFVEVKFALGLGNTNNTSSPKLAYFADFDDQTAPISDGAVYSHPKTKTHYFTLINNELAVSLAPKIALATSQAGVFSGYSQPAGPAWVDCNNPAVYHNGLKGCVDNFTDVNQRIDITFKAWIDFRDPL